MGWNDAAMNYPHTLTIVRGTTTGSPDEWNQPTAGTPTETDVRGFLQTRAGSEIRQANDQGAVASTHVAYVPPGTDITTNDRLRFDGATYQVRFVADGRGLRGTAYRRADLFQVTPQ